MSATQTTSKSSYSLGFSSFLLVFLASCGSEQASEPVTESATAAVTYQPGSPEELAERERNKAVIASYMEVLGDSAAEQGYLAADYHVIRSEFHNLKYNAAGSELADVSDEVSVAIADREHEIVELVGEGSTVVVHYKLRGTHQGNLYGIPATGKSIDIDSTAVFELADGKIEDGWFMAEEAALLIQLATIMPERADGKTIVPPTNVATRSGDDILAEAMANPIDSQEYRNKLMVNAYKSQNAPDGMYTLTEIGRPYKTWLRDGFKLFNESADKQARADFPFKRALPDRLDKTATLIADGDKVAIRFLLTATNSESMYGLPATNGSVGVWEVAIMTFDDDDWDLAWWIADELGMLTQLGGPPEWFLAN